MFSDVVDGAMRVNAWGQIVVECWDALPTHFPKIELDAFVVMPNHVHRIIVGGESSSRRSNVGATHASPLQYPRGPALGSTGTIVGSFKSATTKRINESRNAAGARVWQRNYYEHIIRNEKSLHAIRTYIENNPANWAQDEENPTAVIVK